MQWTRCAAALGVAASLASALSAQAPTIRIGGRVQAQYRAAGGDSSANFAPGRVGNGFEVRRLRMQIDGSFGENATFTIQPSLEMGQLRMRDAYARVRVVPRVFLSAGQEKSPFQRYELTSSNNLPSIERGLRNMQLTGREGLNDLLVNNGYAAHDLGAFVGFSALANRVTVKLGAQNGSRESTPDVNNAKSGYARLTAVVLRDSAQRGRLQVGASFGSRDRAVCNVCTGTVTFYPDSALRTNAWGADLEWGGFRPGLHVIADVAGGDNVRLSQRVNVGRNTGNVRTSADSVLSQFRGASLMTSYRFVVGAGENRTGRMFEPALRLDWLDPDQSVSDDEGLLVTPVLAVFFASTEVLKVGIDFYRYSDGGVRRTATEVKLAWEASF